MSLTNDKAILARMIKAHSVRLFRYAYYLAGERSAAEDLVQDTFLRAFEKIDDLRSETAAYAWLATILRRRFFKTCDKHELCLDDLPLDCLCTNDQTQDGILTIAQALSQLPETYREPILLQAIECLSIKEIANRMGLLEATVATRLFRARGLLKKILESNPSDTSHKVSKL